jgi:hypothetical protein
MSHLFLHLPMAISGTGMADSDIRNMPRGFSRVDAARAFIIVAILAIVSVCYWFLLPAIQALLGRGPHPFKRPLKQQPISRLIRFLELA